MTSVIHNWGGWNKSEADNDTELLIELIRFDQHQGTESENTVICWLELQLLSPGKTINLDFIYGQSKDLQPNN